MKILLSFITVFVLFNQIDCSLDVDKTCLACTKFTNFLWNVTHNADEQVYRSLTKLCMDYSHGPRKQTEKFCNRSLHNLFDFLNEKLNKERFCYDLEACQDNGIRPILGYTNANPADCQFCIFVNTKIKEILTGKPTELEFKSHLEDVCHYLGNFEKDCVSMVDENIDTMFQFIQNNFDPKKCCKGLGVCAMRTGPLFNYEDLPSSAELANVLPVNISLNSEPKSGKDNLECMLCKNFVQIIKGALENNNTVEEIINVLSGVCEAAPTKDQARCREVIREYAESLIVIVTQVADPDTACELVGLCTKSNHSDNTPECVLCKQFVQIIKKALENKATDDEIINVLTEACEAVPRKDRDTCRKTVTQYAQELIQIVTQVADPETACLLAGLCNNSNFRNYLKGNFADRFKSKCVECELIAHFIQNELYNYKNEQQIEEFIKNQLCTKMSFIINTDNCQAFVDQYGPMIIQTIAQDIFNPDELCFKELHLCKKAKVQVISKSDTDKKCSICQSIVDKMTNVQRSDLETDAFIEKACNMPVEKQREDCRSMVRSFGPHFMDMIDRFDNHREICESVDICLNHGKVYLLGGEKCTFGPTYWCHTVSHASACKALNYCNKNIWSNNTRK